MKNRITFYPTPFPDEHILGTLARWHSMQDRRSFLASINDITTNTFAVNPSSIWRPIYNDLFQIYEGDFLTEEFLKHTLWHHYAPFNLKKAVDLFDNENIVSTKLAPAEQIRIKTARNWRWCSLCAVEDLEKYGTTYWHASHQIPSLTRCQKHNETIIHKCNSCGFNSTDLGTLLLPPPENKCPVCKCELHIPQTTNPVVKWIDEITAKLNCSTKVNAMSAIKTILVEKTKLPPLHLRIPSKDTRQVARIQFAFDDFLCKSGIVDHYFQFPAKNHGPRHSYLRIPLLLYSETFFPPLYYLLLMKFLIKDSREIEHILLGEKFYA